MLGLLLLGLMLASPPGHVCCHHPFISLWPSASTSQKRQQVIYFSLSLSRKYCEVSAPLKEPYCTHTHTHLLEKSFRRFNRCRRLCCQNLNMNNNLYTWISCLQFKLESFNFVGASWESDIAAWSFQGKFVRKPQTTSHFSHTNIS